MPTFTDISETVLRDHVRSALIIDDHWPESETRLGREGGSLPDLPEGQEGDVELVGADVELGGEAAMPPLLAMEREADSEILRELRRSLMLEGILTCGIRYRQEDRQIAIALAERADIVVLDWDLAGDEGAEALEILKPLQGKGLRFVCIWTGQGRPETIKERLIRELNAGSTSEDAVLTNQIRGDLRRGNLVIAIRSKAGIEDDPELAVGAGQFLKGALSGLRQGFGGLVQLAILEMTNRHREHVPILLDHIGTTIDTAVLFETREVGEAGEAGPSFVGVLVDEWRSRLEIAAPGLRVLSRDGRQAFGAKLQSERGADWQEGMRSILEGFGVKAEPVRKALTAVLPVADQWLRNGCIGGLPKVEGVAPLQVAWAALQSSHRGDLGVDPLLRLDALLHQQFHEPVVLTQGSVIRVRRGNSAHYLVCTTPLCDAERPAKIAGLYSFVRAKVVPREKILRGGLAATYCVLRSEHEYLCLELLVKERVTLEIADSRFNDAGILFARLSLGVEEGVRVESGDTLELHRVAQLRLDHAFAISAATAADGSRIGVSTVDLIRRQLQKDRGK
jgi:hypothetical protein